jgi:hypothetical protein
LTFYLFIGFVALNLFFLLFPPAVCTGKRTRLCFRASGRGAENGPQPRHHGLD